MISAWPVSWVIVWYGKNFDTAIYLDTMSMINVKLRMMILLI